MNKLEICKRTRRIASDSLKATLEKVLKSNKQISEASFRNLWLKELRKHKEIFPNGWYDPPPYGIIILFASDKNLKRLDFKSVRGKEWWPKKDIFVDRKSGLLLFYASPVDKKTGIIGDFQLTIYLGKNPKIIGLLKKNLNISKRLFNKIYSGMKFKDITDIASKLLKKEGLINTIYSTSDPANFNIGHTIPFSNEFMNELEMKILKKGSWNKALTMISKKRVFLNLKENLKVEPEIAFTIEPRSKPKNDLSLPIFSYHTIALFYKNGKKELLTGFDEIFKLAGMDYML